jgi:spore coat polysaccharide biosynthesis protein SpsF
VSEGVLAIVQARTSSSRLPGKVLKPILGRPMLMLQLERVSRAGTLDRIVVATSTDPSDDRLAETVLQAGFAVHRGPLDDVLERFCGTLDQYPAKHVVRLTGDCPLIDPALVDATVRHHLATGADTTSNCRPATFPDGLDVEVVTAEALRAARTEAALPSEREHVTPFIWTRPERFRIASLTSPTDLSHLRWTVDTAADSEFVSAVYEALYPQDPAFGTDAVLELLRRRPDIEAMNAGGMRNEGYAWSLARDGASGTLAPPPSGEA